jgi:hypothetical protein
MVIVEKPAESPTADFQAQVLVARCLGFGRATASDLVRVGWALFGWFVRIC